MDTLTVHRLSDFSKMTIKTRKLFIHGKFNECIDGLIPNSITYLRLGGGFNNSVESRGKNKTLFCCFPDGEDRKKEKIFFLSFYLLIYRIVLLI